MENVVFYLRNRNSRQVKTNVPISTNMNFFSKICTSYHVIVETIKINSSFSPISMSIKSFKRFHHILQIQFRFDFRFEFQSNFRFEFRFDSDSIPISLHLILSSLGCLRSGSSGTTRCSASL